MYTRILLKYLTLFRLDFFQNLLLEKKIIAIKPLAVMTNDIQMFIRSKISNQF